MAAYSFPKRMSKQTGIVDLSTEVEVTALNCGLEIEAQSLEVVTGDVKTRGGFRRTSSFFGMGHSPCAGCDGQVA